jgi:aminoglycoside phosphotransferase (APT) family kinase protein
MDMVRNFQGLWDSFTHNPPMSVATELVFSFLLSHPLPADRPRRLVHGDVGFHNMMMRDGRLAAILDWELTHIGDPAEDIGYIRAPPLKPLMSWDKFVATYYVAEGGDKEACDLQAVNWYSVWAHTRNSVYVAYLYDLACKGERTDIDAFFPGIDFTARTQHYIARELELTLSLA